MLHSIFQSMAASILLSRTLFVYVSACFFVCITVCVSVSLCLFLHTYAHSLSFFLCLSHPLSIYPSISLPLFLSLSLFFSHFESNLAQGRKLAKLSTSLSMDLICHRTCWDHKYVHPIIPTIPYSKCPLLIISQSILKKFVSFTT